MERNQNNQAQRQNQGNNRNQNKNKNQNQNRNNNGNNNGNNQNQNQNNRQSNEDKDEKDKEVKEKKESRKVRERQLCLLTNKLSRDKKDYLLCSTKQYALDKEKYSKKETDMCCSSCPPRDASSMEARCPVPGKKIKPNKDNMRCFTANMICQKLYMPGRDFECQSKLKIIADICKGCKPTLKADRINVMCLPKEPCKIFSMEAECLQRRLEEGILLTIIYKNREIGHGCYVLPESCILRLTNLFDVVTHTANVELTCHGCTVGMCTVHLAMQMRCPNIKVVTELTGYCSEMEHLKGGMDICMDSSSTDPCVGFMTNETDFDTESDDCCCNPFGYFGLEENSQQENAQDDKAGPDCVCLQEVNYGDGPFNRAYPTISVPDLKETCLNVSRICQVCKEDVSWLPKIAACPHCGYKPVPVVYERPYDENATADGLLHSCLDHMDGEEDLSASSADGYKSHGDRESSDAFDTIIRNYEQLKQSIKKTEKRKEEPLVPKPPRAEDNHQRKSTDKKEEQPAHQQNLAAVFVELKELFKLKSTDTKSKIQEICNEAQKYAKPCKNHHKKGAKSEENSAKKKKKPRRPRKKIDYKSKLYALTPSLLNRCPKIKHNHDFDGPRVPAHMGWLWTSHELARKTGWRPGAIRRSTRQLMRYFLRDFPFDTIPVSKYMSYYNQKKPPPMAVEENPEDLVQKPTLYIEKKNDEYIITLHPLKDAATLAKSSNPYVDMKPVQFRIIKNPLLKEVRDLKRCLKDMGFRKCTCHKPVSACYCRSFIEKKQLIGQLLRECKKRNMDDCENALVLSDTSDSEAEFEFGVTPPAGLIHPERQRPKDKCNAWTQYDENDWVMPTMYPHPPNRLMQYGSCVVGERKKEFNWIFGKGNVHATPKPPIMRNMPKKRERKNKPGKRQAGGFANENSIRSRSHVPNTYSSDGEYPLSERQMRRLDQAAYPPTDKARYQKERHVRFASLNSVNSSSIP